MKYEILNRYTKEVMLTADIDCDESTHESLKMRKAVEWALKNKKSLSEANLRWAYLSYADLRAADLFGADLFGANLSNAYLSYADLGRANLSGADLRKANLYDADLGWANLYDADLSNAYLGEANLSGADLRNANLHEADLNGADLRAADLRYTDLRTANLNGTDLSAAAIDINIPVIPNIHQKVYEAASKPGALDMSQWHSCDTAHCRAGWVVTLAGEDGKALEEKLGPAAAASLIYFKSDPELEKIPNFYCDNGAALADMKALAEKEAQQ